MPDPIPHAVARPGVLGPWSWALGWAAVAAINSVRAWWRLDMGDPVARLTFHAYDLGHFTALALASVGIASVGSHLRRGGAARAFAVTAIAAVAVGSLTLPEDLSGPARRLGGADGGSGWLALLVVGTAGLVPLAELSGRLLARLRLRWVSIVLVLGVGLLDQRFVTELLSVLHLHAGAHLFLAWGTAAAVAGAFADFRPRRRPPRRTLAVALVFAAATLTLQIPDERLAALAAQRPAPAFVYAHFLDPHDPYDQGGIAGSPWERYLAEVAVVDAELGRLREQLTALGLAERTILIISADHGESFGEHNSLRHGATLYDEALRVPLLVYVPGLSPRRVDTPVSLIDLAPTVLDLFGVSAPGAYLGESLVPLMRGDAASPTRPLVFEARPLQAILLADGTKIIRDLRYHVVEAYDLHSDPHELHNRFVGLGGAHDEGLGLLAEFFLVHELQRPGYTHPERR